MFIETGGGVNYLQPDFGRVTLAIVDPTGSVVIEQMGADSSTWFPYKDAGEEVVLDADNTAKGIYAPIKLRVTATGTGVRLYNSKQTHKY